jgi:hypothetical protein
VTIDDRVLSDIVSTLDDVGSIAQKLVPTGISGAPTVLVGKSGDNHACWIGEKIRSWHLPSELSGRQSPATVILETGWITASRTSASRPGTTSPP